MGAAAGTPSSFRYFFAHPAGSETLRAFLVFGALLAVLAGIASQLAFRELSVKVLSRRLELCRYEAERIARYVDRLGESPGGVDFSRVRLRQDKLRDLVHERFARRFFMQHVEVRDRFGVRQFFASRESIALEPEIPSVVPTDWPEAGEQLVSAPIGRAEGKVLVGVSSQKLLAELEEHQRSLRTKVLVATGLAAGVLVVGFFYVLHLLRKNRSLEQARQSAARASYVGLLASGLAHEIRNPLNSMNMNLQMLEEELASKPDSERQEWSELLDSTKSEIKRLERLVNNFLAYARPSSPRFESRDLNAMVREVLRFMEADFRQSGVALGASLESMLPTVEIDETQLKQALLNLLVNARQVLRGGGRVEVRTRAGSGGEVLLEVADDGPGIPAEVRERIFEVFYSSRGGGTGLGLPIARQIVERHNGSIEVESQPGRGTTFRIRLPRHQRAPAAAP